ncbi:MAG: tetratricopeptide repeat protein [Oligoflexia bacterium]|nr:tetratricopeptide repeat protein [Oligoflexia bacterium]
MKRLFKPLLLRAALVSLIISVTACSPTIILPSLEERRRAISLVDEGTLQLRQGELSSAEASFRVAYDLAYLPQALDGLGCVALRRQDFKNAEKFFRGALELDPTYIQALANLAFLLEEQGNSKKAEQLYRKSVELDPANAGVRNNFAVNLAHGPHQHLALEQFQAALVLSGNPAIRDNRALALMETEQDLALKPKIDHN